jgi:cell division protein FtsI (penicillin-binding protein 3)
VARSDEEPNRRGCVVKLIMGRRIQNRRVLSILGLLVLAFVGLAYRLVDLQVFRHDELSIKARGNTWREFMLEPRRGDILDAKGNPLATSLFVKTVCADPSLVGNHQAEVARILSPLLGLPEADLIQKLTPRTRVGENGQSATNRYVVLKRKVQPGTWQDIQSKMATVAASPEEKKLPRSERTALQNLRQKSVFADPVDDQQRDYPNKTLAAHVLGYVGMSESGVETCGKDGIELTFDAKLKGSRGWRVTETDRQKRELVRLRDQNVDAADGLNLVLTIDSVVQHIVESALADAMEKHSPLSASALVVRPRTGEIIAMATLPTFDPNNPGGSTADARRNRVVTDIAEPGSTFKIVVVSGALNDGIVRLADQFDAEHGRFHYAGRVLHDHESYGVLSVEEIIMKSSNIGAAKIGIKMGEKRVYEYISAFGFGTRTGVPLPGEVGGIVHPVKNWSKVSIAQIPMGQGIAVTRLQMAMAMCAIANGGALMRPMLVDRLEDRDHRVVAQYSPQRVRQVMSESAAKEMVKALKTVVSSEGTAPKAALEHYTVAGKTGTAQKVENGVYVTGKYFSSFVGFFPADNPELCVAVALDEPKQGYYGGQTAAPIFKQIAERAANYLNIRPEDGEPAVLPESIAPVDDRPVSTAAARSQ